MPLKSQVPTVWRIHWNVVKSWLDVEGDQQITGLDKLQHLADDLIGQFWRLTVWIEMA